MTMKTSRFWESYKKTQNPKNPANKPWWEKSFTRVSLLNKGTIPARAAFPYLQHCVLTYVSLPHYFHLTKRVHIEMKLDQQHLGSGNFMQTNDTNSIVQYWPSLNIIKPHFMTWMEGCHLECLRKTFLCGVQEQLFGSVDASSSCLNWSKDSLTWERFYTCPACNDDDIC